MSLLEQVCPNVLLVDLGLPSGSGLQLFHIVHAKAGVRCALAVLTVTGNEEHLLTAIGAGAKGYLFKSRPRSRLVPHHSPARCRAEPFARHAVADP